MNELKDYIYVVDSNIEALSKQVTKLRRRTGRLQLGLFLTAVGGVYVADKVGRVTAHHIKEIKELREEIKALKEDKE